MLKKYNLPLSSFMLFCIGLVAVSSNYQLFKPICCKQLNQKERYSDYTTKPNTTIINDARTTAKTTVTTTTTITPITNGQNDNYTTTSNGFVNRAKDAIKGAFANAFTLFDDDDHDEEVDQYDKNKSNKTERDKLHQINDTKSSIINVNDVHSLHDQTKIDIQRLPIETNKTTVTTLKPKYQPNSKINPKASNTNTTTNKPIPLDSSSRKTNATTIKPSITKPIATTTTLSPTKRIPTKEPMKIKPKPSHELIDVANQNSTINNVKIPIESSTTTTIAPQPTTTNLQSSTIATIPIVSKELMDILLSSLLAIGKYATSGGLSRNVRVVNESKQSIEEQDSPQSSKLVLIDASNADNDEKDSTNKDTPLKSHSVPFKLDSQNVHLLCKLLHEKLEKNSNSTSTTMQTTTTTTTTELPFISTRSSTILPNIPMLTTTKKPKLTTTTTTTSTTRSPKATNLDQYDDKLSTRNQSADANLLIVQDPWDLDDKKHQFWLLESVVQCNGTVNSQICSQQGQDLLITIFRMGLASMRLQTTATTQSNPKKVAKIVSTTNDGRQNNQQRLRHKIAPKSQPSKRESFDYEETYMHNHHAHLNDSSNLSNELQLHLANWSLFEDSSDKISIVYWLLRRFDNIVDEHNETSMVSDHFWRVLTFDEADELLEKLDHSTLAKLFQDFKLEPIRVLSSHFDRRSWQPKLPDENFSNEPKQTGSNETAEMAGLDQMMPSNDTTSSFWNWFSKKFATSSLTDNLYLYLILLLLLVFVIALCLSMPMLCNNTMNFCCWCLRCCCCGCFWPNHSGSMNPSTMTTTATDGKQLSSNLQIVAQNEGLSNSNLKSANNNLQSDSIWRKLSNTTTTLVQDDQETMKKISEQQLNLTSGDLHKQPEDNFQWYSFKEDKLFEEERKHVLDGDNKITKDYLIQVHTQQTRSSEDKRQIRKSQTDTARSNNTREQIQQQQQPIKSSQDDRLESPKISHKNTLTKSELVMLKEKLIPINMEQSISNKQAENNFTISKKQTGHRKHSRHSAPSDQTKNPAQNYRQVASQTSDPLNMDSELELDLALSSNYPSEKQQQQQQTKYNYNSNEPTYLNQSSYIGQNESSRKFNDDPIRDVYNSTDETNSSIHRRARRCNEERAASFYATMQPNELQYPTKTQSQIAAIKAQLALLEANDREMFREQATNLSSPKTNLKSNTKTSDR